MAKKQATSKSRQQASGGKPADETKPEASSSTAVAGEEPKGEPKDGEQSWFYVALPGSLALPKAVPAATAGEAQAAYCLEHGITSSITPFDIRPVSGPEEVAGDPEETHDAEQR